MLDKIRTFPVSPPGDQLAYTLKQLTYARIDKWLDVEFNTFGWWLQLVLAIVSLAIFWKLANKKKLLELILYGSSIVTAVIWLDEVGYEIGLWFYPVDLIPVFPPSTSIDYVMLPVIYTLVYQYCPSWKNFTLAISLTSAIFSFIFEPLLEKFGFYVLIKWKFYYSFPLYILLGMIMKYIVEKIKKINSQG